MVSVSSVELSSLSSLDNIGYRCLTTTVPLCHCSSLASVNLLVWATSTKLKGEQIWTSVLLLKVLYPTLCELWANCWLTQVTFINALCQTVMHWLHVDCLGFFCPLNYVRTWCWLWVSGRHGYLLVNEFLASKETVVLCQWERSKQKYGFIKRVDKGLITTVKDLESWRFER